MRNEAREWELVRRSLEAISVDPRDFGRFVNRPHPGVIERSVFDSAAATPVLLEWLPKVTDRALKKAIIGHLRNPAAKSIATEPLIKEFKTADDWVLRWHIGDVLQFVASREQRPSLVPLARDRRYGKGRQMLFEAIGRLKTDDAIQTARDALSDPDVALHAGSALRRLVPREEAIAALSELTDHPEPTVARAAQLHLERLSRATKGAT